jgi:hypothetical protein
VLLIVGVWLLREPIARGVRQAIGNEAPLPSTAAESVGAPTEAAVASAQAKAEALQSANGPDSVVLTANEAASLLGLGLDWAVRRAFDSLRVELLDGRVALHARLETAQLPEDALGLLAGTLEVSEPVRLEGTIAIEEPGRGRLFVEGFRVRAFEFPRSAVTRLVQRVTPADPDGSFLVVVPHAIGGLRIAPDGITLYRVKRGG